MKKLLLLSALLILACSGGDDISDNNSSNYKLVDTINISWIDNETDPPTQFQDNITYNYDGNKLLNITNGVDTVNYLYNNNQISAVYYPGGDFAEAEYDSQGRIITWTYTDVDDEPLFPPYTTVANFVYNQDGSVVQTWQESQESYTFLFDQNGNVTTIINADNSEMYYTYDNKNNPYKNILGNGFFINLWFSALHFLPSLNNNVITAENENNIFFYSYDEDDYPITINSPNGASERSNIQATITYTN